METTDHILPSGKSPRVAGLLHLRGGYFNLKMDITGRNFIAIFMFLRMSTLPPIVIAKIFSRLPLRSSQLIRSIPAFLL